ncbi:MAG: hypothetical protein C0478_16125 [Planctomyces sp.]|nr:hypothetical protein [Planctomyces sp.]
MGRYFVPACDPEEVSSIRGWIRAVICRSRRKMVPDWEAFGAPGSNSRNETGVCVLSDEVFFGGEWEIPLATGRAWRWQVVF